MLIRVRPYIDARQATGRPARQRMASAATRALIAVAALVTIGTVVVWTLARL